MTRIDNVISATVSGTGEVIEYKYHNASELSQVYREVEAKLNAYKQLKRLILDISMQLIMKQEAKKEEEK